MHIRTSIQALSSWSGIPYKLKFVIKYGFNTALSFVADTSIFSISVGDTVSLSLHYGFLNSHILQTCK